MSAAMQAAACAFFSEKQGKPVSRVEFVYDEGYRYSSWTYADPSFSVTLYGEDGRWMTDYQDSTAGDFLRELFAWEESS